MKRAWSVAILVLPLVALHAPAAQSLRLQPRPDWQVGVGLGYGRGTFESPSGTRASYRSGPAFQLRFGHTLGQHAMLGAYYDTWMIEYGEVPTKHRNVQQGLGLGFTCFPGNPAGPSGGIFLRASGGMGWTGIAEKTAIPGEPQGEGERTDEWGFNVAADAGYEFWIARNFTAGLGASFGYLGIDETIVDRAGFAALVLDLNLHF
jgi:hypothetical protein